MPSHLQTFRQKSGVVNNQLNFKNFNAHIVPSDSPNLSTKYIERDVPVHLQIFPTNIWSNNYSMEQSFQREVLPSALQNFELEFEPKLIY